MKATLENITIGTNLKISNMIHQDANINNWAYYVLIAKVMRGKVVGSEYFGFNSIGDAKNFISQNDNLIYL